MRENYNHITEVIQDKNLNDGTEAECQMEVRPWDIKSRCSDESKMKGSRGSRDAELLLRLQRLNLIYK